MKLCPYCKKRIIENKEEKCAVCAEKGGENCAEVVDCVVLTVKNQPIECDGERGFAILDETGEKVGVCYYKKDEACDYDVEAVFFETVRDVYGDNRKIYVEGEKNFPLCFDEVKKRVETEGTVNFNFFALREVKGGEKYGKIRSGYKKVETGIFWVCFDDEGADILFDKAILARTGKRRSVSNVTKDEDGLNYKSNHKKAWETLSKTFKGGKYADAAFNDFPRGRIWYDLDEHRHYAMFDKGLSAAAKAVERAVSEVFVLEDPEFIPDAFYKSKKTVDAEKIKKQIEKSLVK